MTYLSCMLSKVIESDLFNIRYRVNDIIITHISEEIEKFLLAVNRVDNNDLAITFFFERNGQFGQLPTVDGELRIDRLSKQYQIVAKCDGWVTMPVYGDWDIISGYLEKISCVQE